MQKSASKYFVTIKNAGWDFTNGYESGMLQR